MSLSASDQQALRERLEARRLTLSLEVDEINAETAEAPRNSPTDDVTDLAEQGEQRIREAVRHAEQDRDAAELQRIAEALSRMDTGLYGDCVDCGRAIPLARLQAEPAALRCIACQERHEAAHPRPGVALPPMQ
jgi:DnaK suppressor protein